MANKPPKIQDNVPSWMLPQTMREKYTRTPARTEFRGWVQNSRSRGGKAGRGTGGEALAYHGPKKITVDQAQRLAAHSPTIQYCARKYKIPVALICGIILQESGGNPRAVSHCGAQGLMQLMPATARRFGVTNAMDPRQNIEGGTRYLAYLKDQFKGNVPLMVAAYNAGEANVSKYGNRIPPFKETQEYVPNVMAYTSTIHDLLMGGARIDRPAAIAENSPVPRFIKFA